MRLFSLEFTMRFRSELKVFLAAFACFGLSFIVMGPARAQDFSYTFSNPSFGGNPFNSEHLLAIANIHRPDAPADPVPTSEELLVTQLQAQLNSTLSTNIVRAILTAQPGQSGQFTLGDTLVKYVRTEVETRVTFSNSQTGETREIVIPVNPNGSPVGSAQIPLLSAEGVLRASAPISGKSVSQSSAPLDIGASGLLPPPPL